jgi:hypothetical protein
MRKGLFVMFLAAVLGFSTFAHATLTIVGSYDGNNLIYQNDPSDPDNPLKGITWYDYTKSADTWDNQKIWAAGLSVTVNGEDITGWRLPTTPGTTWDYTNEGEMGHLYYAELGKHAGGPLGDASPFQNLLPDPYWSGTEYSAYTSVAWGFTLHNGYQGADYKSGDYYALAVHSGNVGAPVPIPGALFLFAPGLAGIVILKRKIGRRG